MKYCVIKDTTTVVDGSENSQEIMNQNAINAGFAEVEVEILTEEQYLTRKALEPLPLTPPSAEERLTAIEDTLLMIL